MFLNHIYELIKLRIAEKVPEVKEFGWYMGQGTSRFKGGITASPACYLEYQTIDTKAQAQRQQIGTVPFKLIVISDCLHDSHNRMTESINMKHLSIVSAVYEAISGYAPMLSQLPEFADLEGTPEDYQVFTSPERMNIIPDHNNSSLLRTDQLFSTTAKDYSAAKKYTKISRPLEIEKIQLIPSPPFQP